MNDISGASSISPFANGNIRKRKTRGSAIHIQGFIAPQEIDAVNACHPVSGVPGGVPAVSSTFVAGRKNDSRNKIQDATIETSEIRVKERAIAITDNWLGCRSCKPQDRTIVNELGAAAK